jgi:transmembrane sensor
MDEIILRVLKGEASPFEKERLLRWRSESEANESYFRVLSRIWKLSGAGSGTEASVQADEEEVDTLYRAVLATAEARRGGHSQVRARRVRALALWGTSLAAGLAALAFGVRQVMEAGPDVPSAATAVPVVSPGFRTLRLEDGSFVRLASGSQLDVRFSEDRRSVALRGRAFFAVAPDRHRPFLVQAGEAEVRVLGTRFEVSENGNGIRTVVVEGRVSLSSPWGDVMVPEGNVGTAPPGQAPEAEAVADPWSLLDWPGGLLVFHETPLENVAQEVADHFGIPVRLRDHQAGSRRISASFQGEESFREVLETLCVVTSTSCRLTSDSAVIESAPGGGS